MDTIQLSRRLRASTFALEVYDGEEIYSSGTGFTINNEGLMVTAAHVVTGRLPISREDWQDPKPKIIAYTRDSPEIEYRPLLCGITVNMPNILKKALQVDLAVLAPTRQLHNVPFLHVSKNPAPVGTNVLMAGYPDELEPPLLFDSALDKTSDAYRKGGKGITRGLEKSQQLLMIKRGMVGHTNHANFQPEDDTEWKLYVNVYYLDNVMHSGGSGGPVVNELGEVIGTVTKRAVTTVSYSELENPTKEVPSGSALAVSPQSALSYVQRQIQLGNIQRDA